MAIDIIKVRNPKQLAHWDICDAIGQNYCATSTVAQSVRVWRRFSVEYNTAFKTLTQIGENETS